VGYCPEEAARAAVEDVPMREHFQDRRDAGRQLASELGEYRDSEALVIALPRGGVPVAFEVARALAAPLEILAVRKLGAPGNPELAIGAVAEDGTGVLDPRSAYALGSTPKLLDDTLERESRELRRRVERYREGRAAMPVSGRTAIVVDDGLATGLTDLAAVRALRKRGASHIVVAAPVGSGSAVSMLAAEADRVVCVRIPSRLMGVGAWYRDFSPVSDDEVLALLAQRTDGALTEQAGTPGRKEPAVHGRPAPEQEIAFDLGDVHLQGSLAVPDSPTGLVLFAHGSGSSRLSPRNRTVAKELNRAGLATLLADLLDEREAEDRDRVFDIPLLADRLTALARWTRSEPRLRSLPLGYFGASTGAAAALRSAAELDGEIAAVVSRGGRPDLAGEALSCVTAPTLLIVGSRDEQIIALNRQAASQLRCPHELTIVEGASHLFEEPGRLQCVCELAERWFALCSSSATRPAAMVG
jgi:putative phosphoribosyl transferase